MTNNQAISYAVLAMHEMGINIETIIQVSNFMYSQMDRYTEQEAEKKANRVLSAK